MKNPRLEAFEKMANHAMLGRLYQRLGAPELGIARAFLLNQAEASREAFEMALNRMFLDRPKPKNHRLILELLSCANSAQNVPE